MAAALGPGPVGGGGAAAFAPGGKATGFAGRGGPPGRPRGGGGPPHIQRGGGAQWQRGPPSFQQRVGPTLVVLVGVPGCGKTTLAERMVAVAATGAGAGVGAESEAKAEAGEEARVKAGEASPAPPAPEILCRVSQDDLGSRQACEAHAERALERGQHVIIDRCNFSGEQRQTWTRLKRTMEQRLRCKIPYYALFFKADVQMCMERVARRQGHPSLNGPDGAHVVQRFAKDLAPPERREHFDDVIWVSGANPGGGVVEWMQKQMARRHPSVGVPPPKPIKIEGRGLLLFDLNGTLTNHTAQRRSSGATTLRPGTHHLRRLQEAGFQVGIYSSSTSRTIQKAVSLLEAALQKGADANAPKLQTLFSVRMDRLYCDLSPNKNGRPWDTVKPLGKYLDDLSRVVLFDDDSYKILDSEKGNHVLVPQWDRNDVGDRVVEFLVEETLRGLAGAGDAGDLRAATAGISERLAARAAVARAAAAAPNPEAIDLDDESDP